MPTKAFTEKLTIEKNPKIEHKEKEKEKEKEK